ncbi:MAG: glycosyltransferase family 4 protein [Candidatus Bathyarchaeota archaeon]|nr:glycosyltransferase family 4 protein [Candidatus Bathyarchaeota archaeon]
MKILLVTPILDPKNVWAGSHRVVYDTANFLLKNGHDVVVLTSDMINTGTRLKQDTADLGVLPLSSRIIRTKTLSRMFTRATSLTLSIDTIRFIKSQIKNFDVIHGHEYLTFENIVIHYYAKKYNVPYVISAHGSLIHFGKKIRKRLFDLTFGYHILKDASAVIALTDLESQQYRNVGVPDNLIKIVPNGLDLAAYTDLPPKGSFKKKFNIAPEDNIILYLGRINEIKGLSFLVKAFSNLITNSKEKNIRLVIIGADDGYLKELTILINSLNLSEFVVITGLLPSEFDKKAAFVDSVVCIYPGKFEPFGLVSLEAAACGLPVIVISETPMARHVKDGDFGFAINYDDIPAMVNSIKCLLVDPARSKVMGANGRFFVFKNFGWATIVETLENIYQQCSKNKKNLLTS